MNPLQRALIEKIGHDNGFEHVLPAAGDAVTLASARHRASAMVVPLASGFEVCFQPASPALVSELLRSFKRWSDGDGVFRVPTLADLAALLRRAASLSQALPNQAVRDYHTAVAQALADWPTESRGTEAERLVRQRVGQDRYRDALLNYWGGACAVTGVTVTEVLRASHAKPWAECTDDAERLDAFNGFLLVANLDALFDRILISFDDAGHLLISARLSLGDLQGLGIHPKMRLRWLASEHRYYLQWHRDRFLLDA
ncbi:HNH endonuclease [Pseudomonas aeruginosa]|nr:HNH endonuclease [Pseudomonas aeruginosa]MCO1766573.1 HNH endonuclease [Pseudomonas aeruginosa]